MTAEDNKDCLPLQGIDPGIGLFRHYTKDTPQQIRIKEVGEEDQCLRELRLKVLVGDDELCHSQAKGMERQSDKVFFDVNGKELFTLKKKSCSVFKHFTAVSPDNNEWFNIKQKLNFHGSVVSATFTNAFTEQPAEIEIQGCCSGSGVKLSFQGATMARTIGAASPHHVAGGRYDYSIDMAANVDPILVAAIYIIVDEGFAHKSI